MAGIPDALGDAIRSWADATASIEKVWLFGSRARGTHRIDSDVDLALGIQGWNSESADARTDALAEWICHGDDWREQLGALSPLAIHLNPVSQHDERVLPAVVRDGVVLFER